MTKEERFSELSATQDVNQGLRHQTVRAGGFTFGAEAADFVLRISSLAVLSRLLVPEDFGLLAMVTALTAIAEQFKDLGLTAATIQRSAITHAQISTLFWVNLGVGIGLMCIVAGAAAPVAHFFGEPRLVAICLVIATSFLWSGSSVQHSALLRRTMRFGYLAAIDTGASVLSIAVAVIMAVKGYGYWALVAREVVRSALKAVGAWVAMPWIPGLPSRSPDVVPMLRFAGNVTGFNVLRLTSASIGQGLVGRVFGAESLGIYRQALQLILVPIQHLNGPLRSVGDVALSRLQADTLRYRRFYQKFLGLTSFVTLPAMSLVLILAHDIVQIVLGVRWIDAAPVLRVTALAGLFGPLVTTAVAVALSCGHAGRLLRYAVLELAGLSLFFVLGLRWGIVGVASAHLWVACCVGLPAIYWLFKDTPIGLRLFMSTIARPALATGVMAIALLLFRAVVPIATPSVAVVSSGAVAAAVYLLALVVPRGGPEFVAGLLSRHARATAAPGVVT